MKPWYRCLLLFFCAMLTAADTPREPVLLKAADAKMSSGLRRFTASYFDEPFIGRWLVEKEAIDFENLDIEPGRYRMTVNIIPEGGGYLMVKIGESQPIRRPLQKIRGEVKPQGYKFGEVDIPARGLKLRLTGDNIVKPGLCQFFHIELVWLGPLSTKTVLRSPLEVLADKAKSKKALDDAKAAVVAAERLAATLKGTSWNWYTTIDFKGRDYPMQFGDDGTIDFSFKKKAVFKPVDGKTIDIFYNEEVFWRVRFSDDLKSFKADLETGAREPKSGKRL